MKVKKRKMKKKWMLARQRDAGRTSSEVTVFIYLFFFFFLGDGKQIQKKARGVRERESGALEQMAT